MFLCFRLHLPGQVVENEADTGKYNSDNQEFLFSFFKANKNEHFPDLDMIGKLLVPKKKHTIKPVIEDCSPPEGFMLIKIIDYFLYFIYFILQLLKLFSIARYP